MNKTQQFYLTCDGIKLHCKLDLPEAGDAPDRLASAGKDAKPMPLCASSFTDTD